MLEGEAESFAIAGGFVFEDVGDGGVDRTGDLGDWLKEFVQTAGTFFSGNEVDRLGEGKTFIVIYFWAKHAGV